MPAIATACNQVCFPVAIAFAPGNYSRTLFNAYSAHKLTAISLIAMTLTTFTIDAQVQVQGSTTATIQPDEVVDARA